MKACIAAGADAVYMGLPRFSARAYADNEDAGAYADAIRYAHVRGRKLYLTVNTLMKARELTEELPALIGPLYEAGLDGVIVQDLGEMRLLRRRFPELPVHASTQCTVAGPGAVPYLRALGVSRVVPARELSLREIRRIADTGIEVECF
ncbi:MAG: U32 family peptidase, partial [Lachnospiraceae bacterium]|nr:U32 family peptidase [Lachnospiraceae bacterium]